MYAYLAKSMEAQIQKALEVLKSGKTILYPTDTVWGIGCDATNALAVQQIYTLKKRDERKALVCLVADFNMLENYVSSVPKEVFKILKHRKNPTTVIYNNPQKIAPNLIAENNTLALRICQDEFCQKLIKRLGKPIVSSSANISGTPTPQAFEQIQDEIKESVDYIVNLRQQKTETAKPSTIIKVDSKGHAKTIRA